VVRTKVPGARSAGTSTVVRDSAAGNAPGAVASTGNTASAPSGMRAPVMIGAAVPGSSGAGTTPAGIGSPTRSVVPASAARTAKPSIWLLSNGGSGIGEPTARPSTR
jgi:hypothetical protein